MSGIILKDKELDRLLLIKRNYLVGAASLRAGVVVSTRPAEPERTKDVRGNCKSKVCYDMFIERRISSLSREVVSPHAWGDTAGVSDRVAIGFINRLDHGTLAQLSRERTFE